MQKIIRLFEGCLTWTAILFAIPGVLLEMLKDKVQDRYHDWFMRHWWCHQALDRICIIPLLAAGIVVYPVSWYFNWRYPKDPPISEWLSANGYLNLYDPCSELGKRTLAESRYHPPLCEAGTVRWGDGFTTVGDETGQAWTKPGTHLEEALAHPGIRRQMTNITTPVWRRGPVVWGPPLSPAAQRYAREHFSRLALVQRVEREALQHRDTRRKPRRIRLGFSIC